MKRLKLPLDPLATISAPARWVSFPFPLVRMPPGAPELAMNDIGEIRLTTSKPLVFDGYATNRLTGSFILIEQGTNATVAAGMLFPPTEVAQPEYKDFAI